MPQDPHAPGADRPFWETKFLGQMSREEWESLCDGCGKCCLVKLMDPDTEHLAYTEVSCKLLDIGTCRCTDYPNRKARVPDCVILTPDVVDHLNWMPSTCAYKLVHDGDPLPWWHPLVSGDPDMVHKAGISVRNRVTCETEVCDEDLPDYITDWPA